MTNSFWADSSANAFIQTFIPRSRRISLLTGTPLPEAELGACLFADISGFTPLTESLQASLGPQRGAEILTSVINRIFEGLISQVYAYQGDVLGFAGDAILCWFFDNDEIGQDGQSVLVPMRALACAQALQSVMSQFASVPTPDGKIHTLTMKVGVSYGPVKRFLVGAPEYGIFDLITGATVDRMAAAEHYANIGEILCAPEIAVLLGERVSWGDNREEYRVLLSLSDHGVEPTSVESLQDLSLDQLRAYFPPALFQWLSSTQEQFLAELRPVVSVFIKFEGINYELDPQAGEKLNQYLTKIQRITTQYGGNVVRLDYGDKGSIIHVLFGAPIAHEDDEVRAVGWAVETMNAIHGGIPPGSVPPGGAATGRATPGMLFITAQYIGMTKGQVYAGALGASMRRGYTLMGDEVNASARLMQACQPGQILVSQRIMMAAQKYFMFHQFPGYQVKGKYEPIPVAMPVAPLPPMPQMSAGPLVGRERELAQLDEILTALMMGKGCVLRIEGGTGIGKSRLAIELFQRAMMRGVRTLIGNGQSVGEGTPYLPWREILRSLFGLQGAWPVLQQAMQIQTMFQWINPEWIPRVPLLGDLFGLDIPNTPMTAAFDARLRQESLFALVSDILARMASQQPILILIEDCHWLDEASVKLIETLGLYLVSARVLLVVTHRPPDDPEFPLLPGLATLPHAIDMNLGELSPEAVRALVAARLGGEIPIDILGMILERSQGNPFFVEELAETLRETSRLQNVGGRWMLASETKGTLRLPDTVQGVVLARLDRLEENNKLTLKVASVPGRSFETALVECIHPLRTLPETLKDQCTMLAKRDFIQLEIPEPKLTYRFKNNVTQEVAYETLLYAQRRDLHRAVAQWYETVHFASLSSYYPLLVYHFHQAEEVERERHYASLAGEQAASHCANVEALTYLGRALELTPHAEVTARYSLLMIREKVYDIQARRKDQAEDLASMNILVERMIDTIQAGKSRAEVALRQAHYGEAVGDYPAAIAASQAAISCAQTAQDIRIEAMASMEWGRALWRQGEYEAARSHLEHALTLSEAVLALTIAGEAEPSLHEAMQRVEAGCMLNLGIVALDQGDYKRAESHFERAGAIARLLGDRLIESSGLIHLGIIAGEQGDSVSAKRHYRQALQIRREIGDLRGESQALINLGTEDVILGDFASAVSSFEQSLQISRETGEKLHQGWANNNLGFVLMSLGAYTQACSLFEQSLAIFRELGDRREEAFALSNLGILAHHLKDADQARTLSLQALQIAQEVGDRSTQAEVLVHLGHIYLNQREWKEAAASYQEAMKIRHDLEQPSLEMEALAGEMQVALEREDTMMTAEVEPVLNRLAHYLESESTEGMEDPYQVSLTIVHALARFTDPRARTILGKAYQMLQERAARISDGDKRRSYLENVMTHRAIIIEWSKYNQ